MEGRKLSLSTYRCSDNTPKTHRLTFDGGSDGNYVVEICKDCYQKQKKKFLISEQIDATVVKGGAP